MLIREVEKKPSLIKRIRNWFLRIVWKVKIGLLRLIANEIYESHPVVLKLRKRALKLLRYYVSKVGSVEKVIREVESQSPSSVEAIVLKSYFDLLGEKPSDFITKFVIDDFMKSVSKAI